MDIASFVSFALTLSTWMVPCNSKTSSQHGGISYSNDIPKDAQRHKRAGKILGIASYKVIKRLVGDAIELPAAGTTRQFLKSGNYLTASYDFVRTRATDRESFQLPGGLTGFIGKIGDGKSVTLRPSKKDGMPVIVVTTRGKITHRITYTGHDN